MSLNNNITCIGSFVFDIIGKPINQMPRWKELQTLEHVEFSTGGCANNTSICLSRLGNNVNSIGKIGNDYYGNIILENLKTNNININDMKICDDQNTSFSFVALSNSGERAFFHYIGTNNSLCIDDINFTTISNSRILHIAGTFVLPSLDGEPTSHILKYAQQHGVITCLDTVWNKSVDNFKTLMPSMPHIDYFLPSIDEAMIITGHSSPIDISNFLLDQGIKNIILKMGSNGCFIKNKNIEIHIPSFETNVIDTCGAGDSFVGGFLTGLIKEWDIELCGKIGNAAGSICASKMGATNGIQNIKHTIDYMNNTKTII